MTLHYRFLLFTSVFETHLKRTGKWRVCLLSKSISLSPKQRRPWTNSKSLYGSLSHTLIFHLPLHPAPSLHYICGKDSSTRLKWKLSILTLQTWWKKKSICALWDTNTWGFPIKIRQMNWIMIIADADTMILTATLVFLYNKLQVKGLGLTGETCVTILINNRKHTYF